MATEEEKEEEEEDEGEQEQKQEAGGGGRGGFVNCGERFALSRCTLEKRKLPNPNRDAKLGNAAPRGTARRPMLDEKEGWKRGAGKGRKEE
eukprot:9501111-Pyramimonas_sp.AAC.1